LPSVQGRSGLPSQIFDYALPRCHRTVTSGLREKVHACHRCDGKHAADLPKIILGEASGAGSIVCELTTRPERPARIRSFTTAATSLGLSRESDFQGASTVCLLSCMRARATRRRCLRAGRSRQQWCSPSPMSEHASCPSLVRSRTPSMTGPPRHADSSSRRRRTAGGSTCGAASTIRSNSHQTTHVTGERDGRCYCGPDSL